MCKHVSFVENILYLFGLRYDAKDKNYWKVRDHGHYAGKYKGATRSTCDLKFNVLNKVFHNRSNYNYYFIMKELANEFKGEFECLWKNTKKS